MAYRLGLDFHLGKEIAEIKEAEFEMRGSTYSFNFFKFAHLPGQDLLIPPPGGGVVRRVARRDEQIKRTEKGAERSLSTPEAEERKERLPLPQHSSL